MMNDRVEMSSGLTYLDAGVDVDEGNRFVQQTIEPLVRKTHEGGVVKQSETRNIFLDGFGASFDLKNAGFKDPIIEMACDGVGTKLRLAIETQNYENLGIDLVAMCVNDLLARGAKPLAFLDYIGYAKFPPGAQEKLMLSIAKGCLEAGCALVGGETAQMPGFYKKGDFDLAGFALGAIERDAPFRKMRPQVGDKLFAVLSSGFHANGFSLVRAVLDKNPALKKDKSLLQALLKPTRIYTKLFAEPIKQGLPSGIAHITGGGIGDNLPRILQSGQRARIDLSKLPRPQVFSVIQKAGAISENEMRRVFNCGVGVILSVAPTKAHALLEAISSEPVVEIGVIEHAEDKASEPRVSFD